MSITRILIVVDARQVGDTGSTVVEESQTLGDEVEFTEGLTIDRGFLSPYFISDQERSLCEYKNPKVGGTRSTLEGCGSAP